MTRVTEHEDQISALRELAYDLRWTWSHEADSLWCRMDPSAWERTRNTARTTVQWRFSTEQARLSSIACIRHNQCGEVVALPARKAVISRGDGR